MCIFLKTLFIKVFLLFEQELFKFHFLIHFSLRCRHKKVIDTYKH